jgi:hypothetical protein
MKLLKNLSLVIVLVMVMASCQKKKEVFKIPKGYVGMFGFGCLMSKKFIETGLLVNQYDGPFLSAHLSKHRRSWTFAWPADLPLVQTDGKYYKNFVVMAGDTIFPQNLLYLNIKEDPNSSVNGVLYIVKEEDLPTYDGWELGYERFEVTDLISDFVIEGGPVFAYRALPEFTLAPNSDIKRNVIEQEYVDIIKDAFEYWGADFETEYKKGIAPFDSSIIQNTQRVLWENPPMEKVNELKASFNYSKK